mgnify:CR=1 FL=1
MSLPNPAELIRQMAVDLRAHLSRRGIVEPRYIGIRTGGVWVAQALLEELGSDAALGTLRLNFSHAAEAEMDIGLAKLAELVASAA